jgi:hypothetical protein
MENLPQLWLSDKPLASQADRGGRLQRSAAEAGIDRPGGSLRIPSFFDFRGIIPLLSSKVPLLSWRAHTDACATISM